jgi:S1-C subfamily serine protease
MAATGYESARERMSSAARGEPPRRRRRVFAAFQLALALFHTEDVPAQYADVIAKMKPSVVAVGTYQRTRSPAFVFRGTGFVVGDGTTVVTNAHVLPASLAEDQFETLAVVLPGDERTDNGRTAVRAGLDRDRDLAVLKIAGSALPALKIGDGTKVREGDTYLIIGYPIGNVLGAYPVTHRAMISSIVPLAIPSGNAAQLDPRLVRRISSGAFAVFQLDATAYPGNSGSPVIDPATGDVVGVVNMVLVRGTRESALSQPTGITYAIPAQYLRELLATVK